ncbi:hypothetical protein BCR32DRAFT_227854 [Anaeromyces robustus]|uniref:Coth-domain-containing protein n=1 Tax=Anaeromyces robustus TaxID=1754192 RepID=A0A1Y1XPM8_9FUNG|nr:hypothetical protein BCR32DRAFT_227854 [Anaeromyces robustus]|eukprot:ORX87709.1 hypothetical protein BCR32DRAFT_227854 [Anaeromyces robustus]
MELEEYPLYKVEIEMDSLPINYNYLITYEDGKEEQEGFLRTRHQDDPVINEFFNRSITILEHPSLPKAYEPFPYFEQSKLYDDSHVSTILVKCNPQQVKLMHQNTNKEESIDVPAEVIYVTPYSMKTFNNATLSISGQSTRSVPKLSYKISNLKTKENKELYSRTSIKLRAEHMDPSYVRDKIYGDILNSLGVPAAQNKFTRLYINGEGIGLFNLSDDITNGRYLRETFNKGEKYKEDNPIFKADYCPSCSVGVAYGDLGYYGEDINNPMYAIYTYKGNDKTLDSQTHVLRELLPLVKEIHQYGKGMVKQIPLDIDTFLKYMAVEFLGGAVDNFWNKPGNYYIFKDKSKKKWYFHDADFHFSFGVGGEVEAMMNTPLSQYPPKIDQRVREVRPLNEAIITNHPENHKKFIKIIERLLKTSFNPSILYERIYSLGDLIKEDVLWDINIYPKSNPNPTMDTELQYTFEDFVNHINSDQPISVFETVPIKYFINTRLQNVVQELKLQIPEVPLNDLGYVENPTHKYLKGEGEEKSFAYSTLSWNRNQKISFYFIISFLTYLYYYFL